MSSLKVYEFVVTKDGEKMAEGSVLSRREAEEVCGIHNANNGGNCQYEIKEDYREMRVH